MKSLIPLRAHRGITLIELLIAMTIFSVVIGLAMSILFNAQKAQQRIDEKYAYREEADRVTSEIEKSLRLATKLITAAEDQIEFLDANDDTIEYYLGGDTIFRNARAATSLSVGALYFTYVEVKGKEEISDFYLLDKNGDGFLDGDELFDISAVNVYLDFVVCSLSGSKRVSLKKNLFVLFRNLQSG